MRLPHPTPLTTIQSKQRGVSLLFALLALVALMLASLALVRNVDSGTALLGNLGFKQDATAAADQATRQAITWLNANSASLNTDLISKGYYASTQEFGTDGTTAKPPIDATGTQLAGSTNRQLIDWDRNNCSATAVDSYTGCTITPSDESIINGNSASYVILRMCNKVGDYTTDSSIVCARPQGTSSSGATGRGELNYSDSIRFGTSALTYFRILVRVKGARNTISFTETIVHF